MGGTRGSGIVFSAAYVLWISVVRGMSGFGGVCEMCMCLTRGDVGGERVSGTGGVLDVCLCLSCSGVGGVGGVGGEWGGVWTRVWRGDVVLCYV